MDCQQAAGETVHHRIRPRKPSQREVRIGDLSFANSPLVNWNQQAVGNRSGCRLIACTRNGGLGMASSQRLGSFVQDGQIALVGEDPIPPLAGQLSGDAESHERSHAFGRGRERYARAAADVVQAD